MSSPWFDGYLREGTINLEAVFDDEAQQIHIRVQTRSATADGEFGEAIIRVSSTAGRASQSAAQVERAVG